METIQKRIEFNDDSHIELQAYDVNGVTELEEGTIFGIITSKFDMDVILPIIEFTDNGNVSYALSTIQDLIAEEYNIESTALSGGEDIPLIFKKLNDNLAQELLSGKTFVLRIPDENRHEIDNLDISIKEFQEGVEKYSKNNVYILCGAVEDGRGENTCGLFEVNDKFKLLYNNKTLSNREEVVKALESIDQQAKENFEKSYKECISMTQGIANTENFLYEVEHGKPKTM